MAKNIIFTGILVASFFQAVFLTENDGCPPINVKKDQIIRTKEALENGAKYILKRDVDSARECYKHCCAQDGCNLGMLSYKNDSNGYLVRTCYLFDCGSPSKCTYSPYKHYATIIFNEDKTDETSTNKGEKTNQFQRKSSKDSSNDDCPPGAPVEECSTNPCDTETCPSHPWAVCKPSTCGNCHAEFFNDDGQRVSCYGFNKKTHQAHSSNRKWYDKNILTEMDNLHKNGRQNHQVHHNKKTNLETHLHDYINKHPASHKSTSGSVTHKWSNSKRKKMTDPPHHEWREFIDNNPKYGKPHLVTEKPTKKPTTFHQWRDFIDNNPKYTRRPVTPKTNKPTRKTTVKPTQKITEKITKPHKIPITQPNRDEKPLTNSPPKVDEDSGRTSNISDVVVIETSNLRIVENKAVVPLAIFLVIALLLLFVVALRLRVMKSRIRRKAFATDDADYLINGMYL